MEPELAQFESANRTRFNFVNVDLDTQKQKLDAYPEARQALQAEGSIPATFAVDEKGKLVKTWVGLLKKDELERETSALP
ncbi:hypothetical protein DYH09_33615 [bacterium CPR1]|nr:hypothetical protein [bacterium CPR1]